MHLLSKVSAHNARIRPKAYNGDILRQIFFDLFVMEHPEHVHHLSSVLVPQMSYPLIAMSRIAPCNRHHNWTFELGTRPVV